MSANRKDWKWCRIGKHWVFEFPLGVGSICPSCYLELCNRDKDKAEAKVAEEYLERDYASNAI